MSCYQWAKWSLRTCIRSNWNVYNRHCIRRKPPLDNRKGVLLLYDNARPHVARVDRNTIQPLGWETLCHSSYSPDLETSDYHRFHSLDNHFRGKSFTNEADVRQALTDFFASHTPNFTARELNNWRHGGTKCWMPIDIKNYIKQFVKPKELPLITDFVTIIKNKRRSLKIRNSSFESKTAVVLDIPDASTEDSIFDPVGNKRARLLSSIDE
ncbi:histone-lysine N-methyltransferase SETMAR [Trichonephila clavipes]|nr:histone-lysine N-methyltransferase SETMAR [Trichonephila clavipes]